MRRNTLVTCRRSGFTLLEVLLALSIGVMVILAIRALIEGLARQAMTVANVSREIDTRANADRLLRSLVGQLELGSVQGGEFAGDAHWARFDSWCHTPRGWDERC